MLLWRRQCQTGRRDLRLRLFLLPLLILLLQPL
jgi:hypothetical protein